MSDFINEGTLWNFIINSLEASSDKLPRRSTYFTTDGDLILCNDERAAESVANFLEDIGYDTATTGIYDEECGTTWYYIDVE